MSLSNNSHQRFGPIVFMPYRLPQFAAVTIVLAFSIGILMPTLVLAQQTINDTEPPKAAALPQPFKQVTYGSRPILLHLPTGVARAIILPETVVLKSPAEQLPGCAVEIQGKVIGFFATKGFDRRSIFFEGVQTGLDYEFKIRASDKGMTEPLQINRP